MTFAFDVLTLKPIMVTPHAPRAQANNIVATGRLPCALNNPTAADIRPPRQVCRKPMSDEALPKLLLNGANADAAPLGNVIPKHRSKTKKNEIVEYTPYQSNIDPVKYISALTN